MSHYDELEKLYDLKDKGVLSQEEFEREKQRLLEGQEAASTPPPPEIPDSYAHAPRSASAKRPWGMEVRTYCMLLHLSQYASFALPLLGIVLPVVMWAANKDDFAEVDAHGRAVLNWIVSVLLYMLISFFLTFLIIGIIPLILFSFCALIFPIVGAVRANDGELWRYPMSIRFFG